MSSLKALQETIRFLTASRSDIFRAREQVRQTDSPNSLGARIDAIAEAMYMLDQECKQLLLEHKKKKG